MALARRAAAEHTEQVSDQHFTALAFSGSLRSGSANTALIHMAQRIAPSELRIEIVDWVTELPWMNPDLESDPPPTVQRWWDELRRVDALIVGLPEYNFTPSALAKNALDWATRPPDDRAIAGTVIALLSAAGRSGGQRSQDSISEVLGYMGAVMVPEPHVRLALPGERLRPDGTTDDPTIEEAVRAKLDAVVSAIRATRSA
jgi:chromate reductase